MNHNTAQVAGRLPANSKREMIERRNGSEETRNAKQRQLTTPKLWENLVLVSVCPDGNQNGGIIQQLGRQTSKKSAAQRW